MIRSGETYRQSLQDGRAVWIDGASVADVTKDQRFMPAIDLRARIHDMQFAPATQASMVCSQDGGQVSVTAALPYSQSDWWAKRRATDLMLDAARGIAFRIGDDTMGEVWSLHDAEDELNAIDSQFAPNLKRLIRSAVHDDAFLVTGNTDPKGDRTRPPTDQNPNMVLRVVRETDAGLVLRGAKFGTAAAYANRAYAKPTITNWMPGEQSDHAVAFVCDLASPGLKLLCRSSHMGRYPAADRPLSARLDEIEALVVFDDVLVHWEDVIFYRHTRAAQVVRANLHRYSAFAFLQRGLRLMDLLIGTALLRLRQAGLDGQQPVQDRLGELACFRESLNAHLTAAITLAERSPSGLLMPNQSLLYAGRKMMTTSIHQMVEITRELCGGQISLTPDAASFAHADTGPWLQAFYAPEVEAQVEDRRRLIAFAHDLLNSEQASHRLNFFAFAQAPAYTQSAAVYRNFDWDGPLALVRDLAGLGELNDADQGGKLADSAISRWFSQARDTEGP
jgi:4-hydroxyphenylacetate 3-monooxygenase